METINVRRKNWSYYQKSTNQESYENAKIRFICNEKLKDKHAKDKKYCRVRDHCHYAGECREAADSVFI